MTGGRSAARCGWIGPHSAARAPGDYRCSTTAAGSGPRARRAATNAAGARRMATPLSTAGFEVSVIPMADLTQDRFLAWLETVRDVQRLLGPE